MWVNIKKEFILLSNGGRQGFTIGGPMSARTLVSTFSQLRNKGPQLTLVYIRIRNPVPEDKRYVEIDR